MARRQLRVTVLHCAILAHPSAPQVENEIFRKFAIWRVLEFTVVIDPHVIQTIFLKKTMRGSCCATDDYLNLER
jgi:hypothetical protein